MHGQLQKLDLGAWRLAVRFGEAPAAVVVLPVADDEASALLMGGAMVQQQPSTEGPPLCEVLPCEEGTVVDGAWVRDCKLNGDETTGLSFDEPALPHMKVICYA